MPGETEGWGPGSWKGAWGPKPSTSAAAEAGWPGGGPGLLLPLHHANKRQCYYTQYCSAPLKKISSSKHDVLGRKITVSHLPLPAGAVSAALGWQLGG